jgi:acyl carrier protein
MDTIIKDIIEAIEEIADIPSDEITEDSALIDDLDLSSVEILSIIAEIEQKYSINILEDELLDISTVKEFAEVVKMKYE